MNKEIVYKRLALIKYLYSVGLKQSKLVEPISCFSILSFHDSIEMFLKLLAEQNNIKSEKFSFIEYWNSIPTLTLRESMRSLNERRVNLKHKGILPSKSDIEVCRVNTTDFFIQNTFKCFKIHFEEVSLVSLVTYNSVQKYLKLSQKYLYEDKEQDSIENVAFAFDELLTTYENSKSSYLRDSPFYFGDAKHFGSLYSKLRHFEDRNLSEIGETVDKINDSLKDIQQVVQILSYGIDYKKYLKFKSLTPIVIRFYGGKKRVSEIFGERKWSVENCQYCIDFVIECSLILQEFDFDISEILPYPVPMFKLVKP